MSESLVDLLLVRLGREEEKRKVLKLLITSLDLSVSDAEEAVANSPSVIREAVPMGEARVIQKELYPYIDLLPRFDDSAVAPSAGESGHQTAPLPSSAEHHFEDDEEISPEEDEEISEAEPILVTTASEEILTTQRCHICGRTPTDGERLAPCRTCSDLTCRDCFDRIAHVCSKCAASGKSIEHPNEGVEPEPQRGLEFDSDPEPTEEEKGGKPGLLRFLIPVLVVLLAGAAFYLLDPMDMFGVSTDEAGGPQLVPNNTVDADTQPDTAQTAASDTLETDSTAEDTLETTHHDPRQDPLGLLQLRLPQGHDQRGPVQPLVCRTDIPSAVGASAPSNGPGPVPLHMAHISEIAGVEIDNLTLLVYHDTTSVLVMSILHPVETEIRLDLLRRTAQWLEPSHVDQLVLIYRENRYQTPVLISLVRDVFSDVQGVLSPPQFQSFFSYRENCWESVSGPVVEWLTAD